MVHKIVMNSIFARIETDDRVNKDLYNCLYCAVDTCVDKDYKREKVEYKIPLQVLKEGKLLQCPACNRIYITADLTEDI